MTYDKSVYEKKFLVLNFRNNITLKFTYCQCSFLHRTFKILHYRLFPEKITIWSR